jgi:hypothetical protein
VRSVCPRYDAERGIAWERQRLTSKIEEFGKEAMRAERRVGEQREKLKAAMESAAAELAKAGPVRVANSDAVALAAYLQALGLDIQADRVNKLLALLAVLVIECGGGLSLAVAMGLSTPIGQSLDKPVSTVGSATGPLSTEVRRDRDICDPARRQECLTTSSIRTLDTHVRLVAGVQLLALIKKSGGVLVCGQRSMAAALGCSKSWTNVVLHELARAGLITLSTGRAGTVARLPAVP